MTRLLNLSNLKNHPKEIYKEAISEKMSILKVHFTYSQLDTALKALEYRLFQTEPKITIQKDFENKTALAITISQRMMRSSKRTIPFSEKRTYFCLSSRKSGLFWFEENPLIKVNSKNELTELFARRLGYDSYEKFLKLDESLNEIVYDLIVNTLFLIVLNEKEFGGIF